MDNLPEWLTLNFALEFTAVVTGLLYLIEAARLKKICWIYGGVSSVIFIYLFWTAKLYVDVSLSTYYLVMAFVGWYGWKGDKKPLPVTGLRFNQIVLYTIISIALGLFLGLALREFTDASYPITDSFIGALSVTATWLTARKKIETWAFWIVADGAAAVLYFNKGLYLTSLLMLIYLVLVLVAWKRWYKELKYVAA